MDKIITISFRRSFLAFFFFFYHILIIFPISIMYIFTNTLHIFTVSNSYLEIISLYFIVKVLF